MCKPKLTVQTTQRVCNVYNSVFAPELIWNMASPTTDHCTTGEWKAPRQNELIIINVPAAHFDTDTWV